MDLKSIISKPKQKRQSFWTLLLEPGWVSAAIWEVVGEEVSVVSQGPSARWSEEDDLVEVVDTALSSSVTSLPDDYDEPEKTVFGLPSSWIEEGNIKSEYLSKLKKVCDELSLVPSGFVVLSEAIAHYKKTQEGSPLSAVLIGISEQTLEISLFKLGKPAGSFDVSRSVSAVEDLVEGLTRFGLDEVFPSRIIIYDGKDADLEDVRSSLSEASWDSVEKVKFLHTPKIDVLSPQEKVVAVCLAGGAEIAGVTKIAGRPEVVSEIPKETENVFEPKENLTAQDLGFVMGDEKPRGDEKPQTAVDGIRPPTSQAPDEVHNERKPKFSIKLPDFKFLKPRINVSGTDNKKTLIIGGASLVTFLTAGLLFWWFYPKARVTVFVSPKKLDEKLQITLGSDLSAKEVQVSVSGEKTKSTTGTKTVGEKAKGSVKIQNGTASVVNLGPGTILSSSAGLEFTLEKSASVSAALSPSSPGTATVEVVASDIGSEYNLAKDEIFKIGNYPKADVDAVSTDDFTGGSSRQISAVSDEDISDLEDSLSSELLDEAKKKLGEKITLEEVLIDSSLLAETGLLDFSNKSGDEASTLKLTLSLDVSGQVISKKDLLDSSKKLLEGKVPTGFVLRDDQIAYKFSLNEEETQGFDVDVSVNLLPNIDTTQVAKAVVGKYPNLAEQYLSNVPGFIRAEFKVIPLFPGKLGTLPHVAGRIEVEVSADK